MTTLVLVPGLISDGIVWQPLAEAVSRRMPVHAADLSAGTSITGMAQTLLDTIAGDVIVVGHSMGGRIALEMARLAPQRVKGLVLANTGHGPKKDGEEVKRQAMIDLGHSGMDKLAAQWLPPMLDAARADDSTLVAELTAMVLRADADMHERQIRALMGRPNATAYLGEIACPVLLVAAHQDGWSPVAQHQEIAAAVADAELVIIDNAGHFAPVERPQEVTDAIVAWLDRKTGDSNA